MRSYLLPVLAAFCFASCSDQSAKTADSDNKAINQQRALEGEALVQRGAYIVNTGGCQDCHSPKIMTPHGPEPDTTKMLSGHPANSPLPPIDVKALQPGNWVHMAPDITAFVGPWGISYAANLTPDTATGIGNWPEASFIKALRTGKHMGVENGRPIMPPMPWPFIGKMTDDDLRAVFAYLRSLPAVSNRVPQPLSPDQARALAKQ